MARVLDTDVLSFIVKKDTRGALYEPHLKNQFVIVSFMTIAEVEFGTMKAGWGTNRKTHLQKFLRRYYIQHSTRQICEFWAQIRADGRKSGLNVAPADAFVAATALYFNVPLVTHNAADFQSIAGLTVISEQS